MSIIKTLTRKQFLSKCSVLILLYLLTNSGQVMSESPETFRFDCDYAKYATDEGYKKAEGFTLTFIVDTQSGKSYMLGNNGSAPVTLSLIDDGTGGFNFLERTAVGNLMLTTIDANLTSVHSRSGVFSGQLVPSQYYGKCILN